MRSLSFWKIRTVSWNGLLKIAWSFMRKSSLPTEHPVVESWKNSLSLPNVQHFIGLSIMQKFLFAIKPFWNYSNYKADLIGFAILFECRKNYIYLLRLYSNVFDFFRIWICKKKHYFGARLWQNETKKVRLREARRQKINERFMTKRNFARILSVYLIARGYESC